MPYVKDNEIIEIKNLNIPNGYCKIEGTVERDRKKTAELISAGWRVLVIWECELKPAVKEESLQRLCREIRNISTVEE